MSEVLKYKDIKDWDINTIDAKVKDLKKELFTLNMSKSTVTLEKPHLIKVVRKNVARLLTARSTKEK